jgi:hypothetical protein
VSRGVRGNPLVKASERHAKQTTKPAWRQRENCGSLYDDLSGIRFISPDRKFICYGGHCAHQTGAVEDLIDVVSILLRAGRPPPSDVIVGDRGSESFMKIGFRVTRSAESGQFID